MKKCLRCKSKEFKLGIPLITCYCEECMKMVFPKFTFPPANRICTQCGYPLFKPTDPFCKATQCSDCEKGKIGGFHKSDPIPGWSRVTCECKGSGRIVLFTSVEICPCQIGDLT